MKLSDIDIGGRTDLRLPHRRLLRLRQDWEDLGFFLPRPLLRWAEIHAMPAWVPEAEVGAALRFWRSRRIALVKQTAYEALYQPAQNAHWITLALSSACHLGPLAFLCELQAEYHVVRQAREAETFLWKEKFAYDPDPEASCQRRLSRIRDFEKTKPGSDYPSVQDIDWSQYDLVVAFDIPIPARVTQKCPKTLWAYFSVEAGGPLQKNSLRSPVAGYQIFLNHGFRRFRCRPRNRPHVLEFPLQFQSRKNWDDLAKSVGMSSASKQSILIERNSRETGNLDSALPVHYLDGNDSLMDYLKNLFGAGFGIQTTAKPRWGNWAVETVLAGALFLGNANSLAQTSPLLPGLAFERLSLAVRRANELAKQTDTLGLLRSCQSNITEEVCFRRPLVDLTRQARGFWE